MIRKIAISLTAVTAAFVAIITNSEPVRAAWPDRPLTIIVPWGAGGAADQLSRALAPMLEKDLGVVGKNNVEAAAKIGAAIAERAKQAGVEECYFDRGGFLFHGKVKALADAAREGGLKF